MSTKALQAPSVHALSLLFLILLAFLLGFSFPSTYDPDIWWHLKTGEWITTHGEVPWEDPFGANTAGVRWVAYSWLAEVLFYHVDRLDPVFGLRFIQGVLAAATAGVLYVHARAVSGQARLALVLTFLFLVPVIGWAARPQLFSFLFMAIAMLSLWWGQNRDHRAWWLLPPLMALWANVHIYFVMGLGLIWLLLAWPWLNWALSRFPRGGQPSLEGPVLSLVASLAPLLSPYGPALYAEAFHLALHGSTDWPADVIRELASPNFHDWPGQVFMGWVVLIFLAFVYGPKPPHPLVMLLFIALLYRALQHVRDIPYVLLIMLPFLAEHLAQIRQSRWRRIFTGSQGWAVMLSRPRALIHWSLAACAAVAFAALPIRLSAHAEQFMQHRDYSYPEAAVAYLLKHRPDGPLYNTLDWGGYLIHELARVYPVYMDGRTQLYTATHWETHDLVRHGRPDWEKELERSGARVVLWGTDQPLTSLLRLSSRWQLVHEDKVAVVFVKRETL